MSQNNFIINYYHAAFESYLFNYLIVSIGLNFEPSALSINCV